MLLRHTIVCLLACALAAAELPARTPGALALGVVTESSDAHVGGVLISTGSTIYDGETLSTGDTGDAGVLGAASRLYLPGKSALTLHNSPDGALANLNLGTVVFSSLKASAIRIVALGAQIRPASSVPTVAQISIVGTKILQIFARRGGLEFSYRNKSAAILEGSSVRIILDPQDSGNPSTAASSPAFPQKGPRGPLGHHIGFKILVWGSISVATAIAVDEALESPDHP